jgi:membrane protease YdiL (CAAX protease family)
MKNLHPAFKIVLFLILFLLILFIGIFITGIVFKTLQLQDLQIKELLSELALLLVVVTAIAVSNRVLGSIGLQECGLKVNKNSGRELLTGLMVGTSIMFTFLIIVLTCGWMEIKGFAWNERDWVSILKDFSLAVGYMAAVAVTEELFFRGYLLQMFEKFLNLKMAVIVSSVIFALVHLLNPGIAGTDLIFVVISHTLAAILIAMSFVTNRSLWAPIGIHFAWNLMEYYLLGLTGINANEAVFLVTKITGPKLWVGIPGTTFGPETSITGIIVLIGVIVVFSKNNKLKLNQCW